MNSQVRALVLGAAVVVSIIGAACAAGTTGGTAAGNPTSAPSAGQGQTVDVTMRNLKFEPSTITVKAGQPVTVNLTNADPTEHDFVVRGIEPQVKKVVGANQKGSLSFTPTKAGTYEFYCSVPGHEQAGMKGTLTVQ